VRVGRTIRKHFRFLEGMNNRIRMIAQRVFGFHSHFAQSAMIFLGCSGMTVTPPIP
jgi:hypothetical protein